MFFSAMFIIAHAIHDPLDGTDIDDYDVDALLLSTETTLYTLIWSKVTGTVENCTPIGQVSGMEMHGNRARSLGPPAKRQTQCP